MASDRVRQGDGLKTIGRVVGIVAGLWAILGLPTLYALMEGGRMSDVQAAVAWVVFAVPLWVMAWWSRSRWCAWIGARYLAAVVLLAKPVRRQAGQQLLREGATAKELEASVEKLTQSSAELLLMLLWGYNPVVGDWVDVWPRDPRLKRSASALERQRREVILAANELKRLGFVSAVEEGDRKGESRVLLAAAVREGMVLTLEELVENRLSGYRAEFGGPGGRMIWGMAAGRVPSEEEEGK